ncbi:cation transporter [Candidatus Pacearchaeota archaeon]|nr:cation transporter [Candidatus Pacearchaeota archaeon]
MELSLHKRTLILSYFTVFYNILEGILSIFIGLLSKSIALVGFGLDSFVESLSGGIIIWRFKKHGRISEIEEEKAEKRAIKLIAYAFFILGLYVLYESIKKIYMQEKPDPNLFGLIIPVISIVIMLSLFYSKYKIGTSINSRSLLLDSKQTLACIFLSIALLAGLGLNYLFGLWQADPIVGLIIVVFLFREGYNALKEEKLCSC